MASIISFLFKAFVLLTIIWALFRILYLYFLGGVDK